MVDKTNRDDDLILPWQCRAARAALGLGTKDFSKLIAVSVDTLARIDRGERVKLSTQARIVEALAVAGFIIEISPDQSAIRAKT